MGYEHAVIVHLALSAHADRLFAAVEPDLRASALTRAATPRSGTAANRDAREVRVDLEPAR